MIETIALVIICLGLVNVLRLSIYFILGDIYDIIFFTKRKQKLFKPLISVVVPAYNEEKTIMRCLNSIYESEYQRFEVIFVDDGSKDDSLKLVRNYKREFHLQNLKIISQINKGKAQALNFAIKNFCKGVLVMTLDADSILHKEALSRVLFYFQKKDVAAVASQVRIMPIKTIFGAVQYIEYLLGYRLKKAYTILNNEYIIGGIGATYRKSVLSHVGFYDTDTITEDIDLSLKIINHSNKSYKVIYASDVVCFTEPVLSASQLFRQRFRWKYGRFQSLFKYYKLFFNTSSKYTKLLTFWQLPFVIYSELTFLLDPLFFITVSYFMIKYQDIASFRWMFLFMAFYSCLAIINDEYSKVYEKLHYLFLTPFAYIFFFMVSIVEYIGLLKSIIEVKGIIFAKTIKKCSWEHVNRGGVKIGLS